MKLDHALPAVKRVLKHFRRTGEDELLPTEGDLGALIPARGEAGLLFEDDAPQDVEEALGRYGIRPKLEARGFTGLEVGIELGEDRQVVRVSGSRHGRRHLLGEAILKVRQFVTDAPFARMLAGRRFRMLFIQWLRLQDPTSPFSAVRPALPGQIHPGLGVGREVMSMFLGLASRLGFSGTMVCPEFAHNAVLYFSQFRFLDPASQGRFEALMRCIEGRTLAEFAWGVERGCVDDLATGRPFRWFHEEMLRATDPTLDQYLSSEEYLDGSSRARASTSLAMNQGRLAALGPIPPAGLDSVGDPDRAG